MRVVSAFVCALCCIGVLLLAFSSADAASTAGVDGPDPSRAPAKDVLPDSGSAAEDAAAAPPNPASIAKHLHGQHKPKTVDKQGNIKKKTGTSKTDHKIAESKSSAGSGHSWNNPDSTHGKGEKKGPEQLKSRPEPKRAGCDDEQRPDKQHKQDHGDIKDDQPPRYKEYQPRDSPEEEPKYKQYGPEDGPQEVEGRHGYREHTVKDNTNYNTHAGAGKYEPTEHPSNQYDRRHEDTDKPYYGAYGGYSPHDPEQYYGPAHEGYDEPRKPKKGCGGDLPPPCSARVKPYPDYDSSYEDSYKDDSYYSQDNPYGYGYNHKKDPCWKAEAAYAWSPDCAKPTDLGATCEGAALCSPTNARTTTLATCAAWGWVVTDGCKPLGCAATPISQLATFSGCKTPGVLEQECQGICQVPSVGGPVATCTPAGWAISGPLCDFDACGAVPAPCDGNAACTDKSPPALDAICECLPGFAGNGAPGNCTEIDACAAFPAPCDANATCTDNPPPFIDATCTCNEGFVGNGLPGNCTEIDGCAAIPSPCDGNATCTDNLPPLTNATCVCNEGYIGDGTPGNCVEAEDACTPANNPCNANAYCIDRDPPLTGAVCVCKEGFTGNGSTCTQCTGTQWSPGGDVPCSDLALHSQYFGESATNSQSRSMRSLATDGDFTYVGMVQGSTSSDVIKVSASPLQYLIGNGPNTFTGAPSTNPYFNDGVIARIGQTPWSSTPTPQGPKGLALDDLGFVYHTDNTGRVYARDPDTTNLDILALTFGGPSGTNLAVNAEALAFKRVDGVPYLYGCSQDNAAISRLRINYDTAGRPASFSPAAAIPISTPFGCRGVSVEDDGTVYYTGIAAPDTSATTGRSGYFVAKVAPDGAELHRTTVPGAWGLAHYNGRVYVAQYLSTNTAAGTSTGSGVAVLSASDLTLITTLKPPAGLARIFQDTDSGYSGLAVSPTGILYVADQIWKRVGSGPTNTPLPFTPDPVNQTPVASITSGLWFFDRVLQRQV